MLLFPANYITAIDNPPHSGWVEIIKHLLETVTAGKDKVKVQDQRPKEIVQDLRFRMAQA